MIPNFMHPCALAADGAFNAHSNGFSVHVRFLANVTRSDFRRAMQWVNGRPDRAQIEFIVFDMHDLIDFETCGLTNDEIARMLADASTAVTGDHSRSKPCFLMVTWSPLLVAFALEVSRLAGRCLRVFNSLEHAHRHMMWMLTEGQAEPA